MPGLSPRPDHPVTALAPLAPSFARSALPRKRVRSVALIRPSPTADERPVLARNRTSQGFYRCSFMRSRPSALETLNEPLVSLGVRFTSRLWAFLSWLAAPLMPFPPVLGIMAGAVQKNRRPSPLGNVPG